MTNREMLLEAIRVLGRYQANILREESSEMTPTEIIDMEYAAPAFNKNKDYSSTPAGSPVSYEGQVYKLITPHNASSYEGNPASLPALWSLLHTKNPLKAKPYMAPNGTSGMYMKDECYLGDDGPVYKCKSANCVRDSPSYPSACVLFVLLSVCNGVALICSIFGGCRFIDLSAQ